MDRLCHVFDRIETKNCAGVFRFAEILELSCHFRYSCIEYIPHESARLSQDLGGLLRVATGLVTEAAAVAIHLDASFHDNGPGDQDVMRRRQGAMTLIGAEMGQLRAERAAPHDSMTAISGVPEVECTPHLGDVATNEIGIASKSTAGENQRIAPDPLARAVRTDDLDSENAVIR